MTSPHTLCLSHSISCHRSSILFCAWRVWSSLLSSFHCSVGVRKLPVLGELVWKGSSPWGFLPCKGLSLPSLSSSSLHAGCLPFCQSMGWQSSSSKGSGCLVSSSSMQGISSSSWGCLSPPVGAGEGDIHEQQFGQTILWIWRLLYRRVQNVGPYSCPPSARVIARVQEALDPLYGHNWWEEYVRVGKRLNSGLQHLGAEGPLYTTSFLGLV